jgi:hypothetical protein
MKKNKIIFIIILMAFFINSCKKEDNLNSPKVPTYEELIIGKWVTNNTLFYKYAADSTGSTWDTSDDVTEAEAQKFTWNIKKSVLTQTHIMEIGGNVPKVYTITSLNATSLVYKDNFGNVSTFTKVP